MAVSEEPPAVRLELESTPETLTLVRGALGALAELLSLDAELLDDLKTAVSEACNNVVMHAYDGAPGPLEVAVHLAADSVNVVVRDEGRGIPKFVTSAEGARGVGIPIIRALAQRAEFRKRPAGGTEVCMEFSGERRGKALLSPPPPVAPDDGWTRQRSGDAVVTLSPVSFLGPILGRLARALAARARFSLDRFSDVYLVTDAIAAQAARSASGSRIGFAIVAHTRRLQIAVGPMRPGTGDELREPREVASALLMLSDAVAASPDGDGELLSIVITDRRPTIPPAGG
jgi:serine/threonine-protein kinase RsbW